MKYIIDIKNIKDDTFGNNGDNVGTVKVYDKENNDITSKSKVQLFLSRNALLGLGTWLIRFAHQYREGKHFHIDPAEADYIVQSLGIFLAPNSAELIVSCEDSESIEDYFQEDDKSL